MSSVDYWINDLYIPLTWLRDDYVLMRVKRLNFDHFKIPQKTDPWKSTMTTT